MSNWDELHKKLIEAFEQPKKITDDGADKSHTIIQIFIGNDINTFNISDKSSLKLKNARRIRNVKNVQ